jgi:hypothetical protein
LASLSNCRGDPLLVRYKISEKYGEFGQHDWVPLEQSFEFGVKLFSVNVLGAELLHDVSILHKNLCRSVPHH